MTTLGITGPTGAGKTTFLREVERLGGAVIDCDAVYHRLLEEDAGLQATLERAFGPLRDPSGRIDRKKLGGIVFADPEQLERLNAIAWTAVTDRVRVLLAEAEAQGRPLAAIDAVALLESPLKELCQQTVAILAPPEVRVRRVMAREGVSEDYAWARVKAQKPDGYFSQHCGHILVNGCASAAEFAVLARKTLKGLITP